MPIEPRQKLPVRPPFSSESQSNGGFQLPQHSTLPSASTGRRYSQGSIDDRTKTLPPVPPSSVGTGKTPPPPPPTKNAVPSPVSVNGNTHRRPSLTSPCQAPQPAAPSVATRSLPPVPTTKMNGHVPPAFGGTSGPQFRLPAQTLPRTFDSTPDIRSQSAPRFPPPPPSKFNGPTAPRPPAFGATPPAVPPPMHRPPVQVRPSRSPGLPPALPPSKSAPALASGVTRPGPPAMRGPRGPPPALPPPRGPRPPSSTNTASGPLRLPSGPPPPLPPPRMTSKFR